ncbi:hypothetical protein BGZ60DRAFT_434460 [Tricladium varicosporioides]|nr:hypothetical protein BGZ60DRAFT_434460 [Hymenoscyphus varicosporioides]
MGFMKYLSTALAISQQPSIEPASIKNHFRLEVWLKNSPLNRQSISWYRASGGQAEGFFGINVIAPGVPMPEKDVATFIRDTANPESLFMSTPSKSTGEKEEERITNVVVHETGILVSGVKVPTKGFPVFEGNFSMDYFTNWPDKKSYDFLQFQPPGIIFGTFLGCPRELTDKRKIYQLYAMTPAFHRGGCITLDWLVAEDIKLHNAHDAGFDEFTSHELL